MNEVINGTVTWRGLLQWLEALGGNATLQRAYAVWGYKACVLAVGAGDASCPWAQPGAPSIIVLTDQGRAKL